MIKRLLVALLLVLTVAASASQLSIAQDAPPRPVRDLDTGQLPIEHLPAAWPRNDLTTQSTAAPLSVTGLADWSKLTYQSYFGNWDIYAANGNGASVVRLTSTGGSDITPRFNRGAARIVFASNEPGNYEIFAMDRDGRNRGRLTNQAANDYNPAWSSDGSKILFNTYRDGQSEIYMMEASGANPVRVTYDPAYDGQPVWSPDGAKIAFLSDRSGSGQIWVMGADGHGPSQLTSLNYAESPVWSPDGTRIAFDADSDGDGWQELMVMNADGSNMHVIGDTGTTADMWARSWSPDGRSVAFTAIYFVYYYGNWYWTAAYSMAADTVVGGAYSLGGSDTDWYPDWQTTDVLPPTSNLTVLPATSPSPIVMKWSGVDAGPSGILGYDVQVKDGAGVWTMWLTRTAQTSASYPGVGGHTYAFRVRAVDNSSNFQAWPASAQASTTVEALPPVSAINPLPAYYRGELPVSWGGNDPGGSGIQTYDVQHRDGITGTWSGWLSGTTLTTANFNGTAGHTYAFRVRATDRAQNVGVWTQPPDEAVTLLYSRLIDGMIYDTRGRNLVGAAVTLLPGALTPITSTARGYLGYLDGDGPRAIAVTHPLFGQTPPITPTFNSDTTLDHWLPPLDDAIQNGSFESGPITTSWILTGDPAPVITSNVHHTGQAAVSLGNAFRFKPIANGWTNLEFNAQVDKQGTLHVIGTRQSTDGLEWELLYSKKPLTATTFPSPTVILTLPPGWQYIRRPSFLIDDQGGLHIVGIHGVPSALDVVFYCFKGAASQTCTTPMDLGSYWPDTAAFSGPQIAKDRLGGLHAVWAYYTVQYAYCSPSGVWSASESLSGQLANAPDIAVDKNNVIHVIWGERQNVTQVAMYRSKPLNGTWAAANPMGIYEDFLFSSQLEVTADGGVHTLWNIRSDQVAYTRYLGSNSWQSAVHFPARANGSGAGYLTFDQNFRPIVITSNDSTLYYNYLDRTDDWRSLAGDRGNGLAAELFAWSDSLGDIHVLWHESAAAMHYLKTDRATSTIGFSVAQSLIIPTGTKRATASVLYRTLDQFEPGNRLRILVNDGLNNTEVAAALPASNNWEHGWAEVSPWAGQSITLTVEWQQVSGIPMSQVFVDEISLGSWLTPDPQAIMPSHINLPATRVITITGDNFFATPQVRVNDVPLPDVTWINTTTLTATVPVLPFGRYDLIVTNPGGQASGLPRALLVGYEVLLPIVRK